MTHKTVQSNEGVDKVLQVAANANAWHRPYRTNERSSTNSGAEILERPLPGSRNRELPENHSKPSSAPGHRRALWAHETSAWAEIKRKPCVMQSNIQTFPVHQIHQTQPSKRCQTSDSVSAAPMNQTALCDVAFAQRKKKTKQMRSKYFRLRTHSLCSTVRNVK